MSYSVFTVTWVRKWAWRGGGVQGHAGSKSQDMKQLSLLCTPVPSPAPLHFPRPTCFICYLAKPAGWQVCPPDQTWVCRE